MDGLDELSEWDAVYRDNNREVITSVEEKAEIPLLIYHVIHGKLLQYTYLIVTTRPIESISSGAFDDVLIALGFDENAIDECTFAVCNYDRTIHRQITEFLQHRTQLYTYCVVPLNCVLCTSILRNDLKDPSGHLSKTGINSLTQLGVRIILDIMHKGTDIRSLFDLTETQKLSLSNLGRLAAGSLLGDSSKLIFNGQDLHNHNIEDVSGLDRTISGLLEVFTEDDISNIDSDQAITASFLHLSIQEFLAAVHICLTWMEEDVRKVATVDPKSRRLDNVQLYTAGLLGDSQLGHKLLDSLRDLHVSYNDQVKEFVSKLQTHSGGDSLSKLAKLQLIRCAHEGRMKEMVQNVGHVVLESTTENKFVDINGHRDTTLQGVLHLSNIEGGLLPHHLSSIGYFVQEYQQLAALK